MKGEYKRYFAKKTNELIYMEISKEDYDAKVDHINNQYQIIDTKMNTIIRLLEAKNKNV